MFKRKNFAFSDHQFPEAKRNQNFNRGAEKTPFLLCRAAIRRPSDRQPALRPVAPRGSRAEPHSAQVARPFLETTNNDYRKQPDLSTANPLVTSVKRARDLSKFP